MPILDRRNNQLIEDKDTRVSVGLNFPISRAPGNQDGFFSTSKTTIESIKNNIRLLLQTQKGERMFQPNLGMGIRRFLFEQITEDTQVQIENDIVDTFATWLPFVELREIDVDLAEQDQNKINIKIVFNIKRAPNTIESVGVVLE
jgi:phage baseplate assembly protein W